LRLKVIIRAVATGLVLLITVVGYSIFFVSTNQQFDGSEDWYSLHWKGEKVGHVQINYTLLDNNLFMINQFTSINTTNRGVEFEFTEREELIFESNNELQLKSVFYEQNQNDYHLKVKLTKHDGLFSGNKWLDDRKLQIEKLKLDYDLKKYFALRDWIRQKPKLGAQLKGSNLDFNQLSITPINYTIRSIDNSKNSYHVEYQQPSKDWVGEITLTHQGLAQRYAVGSNVVQQRTSKANAIADNSSRDYYQSQVIRLNQPLGNLLHVKSIEVEVPEVLSESIILNGRQNLEQDGVYLFSVGGYFTSDNKDDFVNNFTEDKILKLADSLVNTSDTDLEKVDKLLQFVSSYLEDYPVVKPMTIDQILSTGKGDCTEHTRLFNALANALDIPSREVQGLLYLGDEAQAFGGHVWSEVLVNNQWRGVDSTLNQNLISATHIQLKPEYLHQNSNHEIKLISINREDDH